jgi:hypothetical protein
MKERIPEFKDQILQCVDCGNTFVWTASEQKFFYTRSLCPPKRCKRCRDFRRSTAAGRHPMDFDTVVEKARALFPTEYP